MFPTHPRGQQEATITDGSLGLSWETSQICPCGHEVKNHPATASKRPTDSVDPGKKEASCKLERGD